MKKRDIYKYLVMLSDIYNKHVYGPIALSSFGKVGEGTKVSYPIFIHGGKCITLGNEVHLNRNTRIEALEEYAGNRYRPKIKIGNRVTFGPNCHIGCINKVLIGNDVLIGPSVLVTDHSHGSITIEDLRKPPYLRRLYSKGAVIIEDNVWVGERVSILPGVTIGKNSIIGANTVVTKSVPANSVIAGNPYRIIKTLQIP